MKEITMQEEDTALINTYKSNTGTPIYIKQVTHKMRETDNNTIKAGELNAPLTSLESSARKSIWQQRS